MKKQMLFTAGLLGVLAFSSFVGARNVLPEIASRELCQNSAKGPYYVAVASHQAVNVASSTVSGALAGAFFIEVYNNSADDTINCSFDALVSTIPANAYLGREVPPKTGVGFMADFDKMELYCKSQSVTAATSVDVFQCR